MKYGIDTNVEYRTLIKECRSGNKIEIDSATPARRGGLREIGLKYEFLFLISRACSDYFYLISTVFLIISRLLLLKTISNVQRRVKNVEVRNRRLCKQHVV